MHPEYSRNLTRSSRILRVSARALFALFEFRKNRASYSVRPRLINNYGYASAYDRTDYSARFRLRSESFMKYPGGLLTRHAD